MNRLKKKIRHALVKYLTKNMLVAITEEDVLILSGKDWLIGRKKLTSEELIDLKEEAISFERSLLWKLISNDIKFHAIQQMSDKALSPDDIIFGKSMLYNLGMIRKFISNLKGL